MQEQARRGGDLREPSIVAARRERTHRPRLMRVPVPGRAHCWFKATCHRALAVSTTAQCTSGSRATWLTGTIIWRRAEWHRADDGVALKHFSQRRGSTDYRREARRAVVALTASRVLFVASAGSENSGKTQGKPL